MSYLTQEKVYPAKEVYSDAKIKEGPLLPEMFDRLSTEVSKFQELNYGIKQKIRSIHMPAVTEGTYNTSSASLYAGSGPTIPVPEPQRERTLVEKFDQLCYELLDANDNLQKLYAEICNII